MADLNALTEFAREARVNFTGTISHSTVQLIAPHWMPDINFHEDELFYPVDLKGLYDIPPAEFANIDDPNEQQKFRIEVGGIDRDPPIIRTGEVLRGEGTDAIAALELPSVDNEATYSHGGNFTAANKFFGSIATKDGTPEQSESNPRLPRHDIIVRAEFRMLLETLKADLALDERPDGIDRPADAIWGDFDVTDILLKRARRAPGEQNNNLDSLPVTLEIRHNYARALIEAQETQGPAAVEVLLDNPPVDTGISPPINTVVNRTAWLALKTVGLMEYYFIYAYNDFRQQDGGLFTNEHEGDIEGCCLVFERLGLQDLENSASPDPTTVVPIGIITSAHEESNKADRANGLESDAGDVRQNLDVYVARGSHATYLEPGTHDFTSIVTIARAEPILVAAAVVLFPSLVLIAAIYEHFAGSDDVTSEEGVTAQSDVDPASDPATHFESTLVVTPLSDINSDSDQNIYNTTQQPVEQLALRAFNGRLGNHSGSFDIRNPLGFRDKSPKWQNKTRRYFKKLVGAIDTKEIRRPLEPPVFE